MIKLLCRSRNKIDQIRQTGDNLRDNTEKYDHNDADHKNISSDDRQDLTKSITFNLTFITEQFVKAGNCRVQYVGNQSTDDKRHQNRQTFFNIFQCRVPGCDQIDDDRTEKDDKHRINTDCKIPVIGRKFIFLDVIIRFVLFLQIHGHPPYKMFKKRVTSNYKRHGKLVQVFFLKKTIKKLKKKLAICKTIYYNMSCVRGNATQDMRD